MLTTVMKVTVKKGRNRHGFVPKNTTLSILMLHVENATPKIGPNTVDLFESASDMYGRMAYLQNLVEKRNEYSITWTRTQNQIIYFVRCRKTNKLINKQKLESFSILAR